MTATGQVSCPPPGRNQWPLTAGLKKLPYTLTRHDLEVAQATVLSYAEVLGPKELRILASRMIEVLDPAGAEDADKAIKAISGASLDRSWRSERRVLQIGRSAF